MNNRTNTGLSSSSNLAWREGEPMRLLQSLVGHMATWVTKSREPFVLTAPVEQEFRQLTEIFGFERLPATYDEAVGLLSYCQMLETALTFEQTSPVDMTHGHTNLLRFLEERQPMMVPAMQLAFKKDVLGLRELHKAEDTLARLGKTYFLM